MLQRPKSLEENIQGWFSLSPLPLPPWLPFLSVGCYLGETAQSSQLRVTHQYKTQNSQTNLRGWGPGMLPPHRSPHPHFIHSSRHEERKVDLPQNIYRSLYISYKLYLKTRSDTLFLSHNLFWKKVTDFCSRSFLIAFGYKHCNSNLPGLKCQKPKLKSHVSSNSFHWTNSANPCGGSLNMFEEISQQGLGQDKNERNYKYGPLLSSFLTTLTPPLPHAPLTLETVLGRTKVEKINRPWRRGLTIEKLNQSGDWWNPSSFLHIKSYIPGQTKYSPLESINQSAKNDLMMEAAWYSEQTNEGEARRARFFPSLVQTEETWILGSEMTRVLALSLTCSVTLDKVLSLTKPQSPHQENGNSQYLHHIVVT